jgi:hypothetical protein
MAGANKMRETIVPKKTMMPYIILLEVEFLHDGHDLQHMPHAAVPQQHAIWRNTNHNRTKDENYCNYTH